VDHLTGIVSETALFVTRDALVLTTRAAIRSVHSDLVPSVVQSCIRRKVTSGAEGADAPDADNLHVRVRTISMPGWTLRTL
jgi:hypothetical protein